MSDAGEPGWFSESQATFGDRVAGAREAAGLSQEELSRRLGVLLSTVQGWEDDVFEPRANKLQMLAGFLNVSIRWLLTGEGDGLDGPPDRAAMPSLARQSLQELSRIRQAALALSQDIGRMEERMRALLRETAE
jgi:HTH-type transcriptional regulator, cell division transcriptional repressor